MSTFKRGGHLVQSQVQRAVLLRFMLHWLSFAATFFGIIFSLHFFMGDPNDGVNTILWQMWQRYSLLVVVTVALVPYFLYDLIKLTHRFAGPMVRFGNVLRGAAKGETVQPIKFRKGDYWQDMAGDLNTLILRLQHEQQQLNEPAHDLSADHVEDESHLVTI